MSVTAQAISEKIEADTGNTIDPKFFYQVSDFAHFGMMFFVTTLVAFLMRWASHFYLGLVLGFSICLIYAIVHEFWYDVRFESPITRGSDWRDFGFLLVGSLSAVGLLFSALR